MLSQNLHPTSKFLWTHLQEPEIFLSSGATSFSRDPSCHIKTPTCILFKEFYKQKWYRKGLIIVLLEESYKEYLQVSLQGYSALMHCHEQTPQEAQRTRWPRGRNAEQSALTHARHTHSASRQLGITADQRYDVTWDWLRDSCQLARVRWGTCCKGFCSKEGLHYCIGQSARNQLEHNQVPSVFGESSRSCC